jgi:hypothetical protein
MVPAVPLLLTLALSAGVMPMPDATTDIVLLPLPPGFPYVGGACGIGEAKVLDYTLGLNCGGGYGDGGAVACSNVPGGHSCDITFSGEAVAFRWINTGGFTAEILGSCSDSELQTWSDSEAFLAVSVGVSCSIENAFVAEGTCEWFGIIVEVRFFGANAPADSLDGESVNICA